MKNLFSRTFIMACVSGPALSATAAQLPNSLWITCEDIGPHLGCYGDSYSTSPNLDKLATKGMIYKAAWSIAPVCAPARTTIITGVYPTCLGAEHMRSEVAMPAFMRMYPQFLRDKGYYCSNNSKEDYNVTKNGQVWDDSSKKGHWRNRQPGQPFFAIFNLEITHESQIRKRPHTFVHDPAKVRVPAYHPDTPEVRQDWAQYYDNITTMDGQAGKLLGDLQADGLADDTIVVFYGDHGSGMPRNKRWPYDSGLHVGPILYVPSKFKELAPKEYHPGARSDRLIGFIDLAPSMLSVAGIQPPDWMQGHAFMGKYETAPPKYLFGFRGRMDERYDMTRSVRNERYVYLRQYMPHLIYGQYIDYMFQTPTTRIWKELYDAGKLKPPQTYFWETKPPEELYDLQSDPDETKNLVNSPEHQAVLNELRQALREQTLKIRDVGFLSEAEQHRRAAGTTMYEMGHDPKQYPLERILAMADTASLLKPDVLPQLKEGLKDTDSGVRYWAAMGFLMRGKPAVGEGRDALRSALRDESPTVRVIAARALGVYGNEADLALALPVLKDLAPADKNGAYVSLLDVNAIEALGPKAAPLIDTLKTLPTKDPKAVSRANNYVSSLVRHILVEQGQGGDSQSAPAKKADRPKKGKKKAA